MSTVKVAQLSEVDKATLACTYAALILHDNEMEIDATRISKILTSAGIKIEKFWPKLFAKTLSTRNM